MSYECDTNNLSSLFKFKELEVEDFNLWYKMKNGDQKIFVPLFDKVH